MMKTKHYLPLMLLLISSAPVFADSKPSEGSAAAGASGQKCYPVYINDVRMSSCDIGNASGMGNNAQQRNAAMVSSSPRVYGKYKSNRKNTQLNFNVRGAGNGSTARGAVGSSVNVGF